MDAQMLCCPFFMQPGGQRSVVSPPVAWLRLAFLLQLVLLASVAGCDFSLQRCRRPAWRDCLGCE
jgi:hypothetical protein